MWLLQFLGRNVWSSFVFAQGVEIMEPVLFYGMAQFSGLDSKSGNEASVCLGAKYLFVHTCIWDAETTEGERMLNEDNWITEVWVRKNWTGKMETGVFIQFCENGELKYCT